MCITRREYSRGTSISLPLSFPHCFYTTSGSRLPKRNLVVMQRLAPRRPEDGARVFPVIHEIHSPAASQFESSARRARARALRGNPINLYVGLGPERIIPLIPIRSLFPLSLSRRYDSNLLRERERERPSPYLCGAFACRRSKTSRIPRENPVQTLISPRLLLVEDAAARSATNDLL